MMNGMFLQPWRILGKIGITVTLTGWYSENIILLVSPVGRILIIALLICSPGILSPNTGTAGLSGSGSDQRSRITVG